MFPVDRMNIVIDLCNVYNLLLLASLVVVVRMLRR